MITNYNLFENEIFENNLFSMIRLLNDSNKSDLKKYNLIKKYINSGGIINKIYNGQSLLIIAVISNYKDIVKLLIDNDADVNIIEPIYKTSPLLYAASNNYVEITQLLINNGADINSVDVQKETPLIAAAKIGVSLESILILLKHGAKLTMDNDGYYFIDYILDNYDYEFNMGKISSEFPDVVKQYKILKKSNQFNI